MQSESPWQCNDAITFFIYPCVSLYQVFFYMVGGAQAKMSTWFSKPNQSLISKVTKKRVGFNLKIFVFALLKTVHCRAERNPGRIGRLFNCNGRCFFIWREAPKPKCLPGLVSPIKVWFQRWVALFSFCQRNELQPRDIHQHHWAIISKTRQFISIAINIYNLGKNSWDSSDFVVRYTTMWSN